jgi:hypothetical protein
MSSAERVLAPTAAAGADTASFPEEYGRPPFLFNVYRLTVGLLLLIVAIWGNRWAPTT